MLQKTPDGTAERRRGTILDAASRCFAQAGFHRTTMQEVAAAAGMSPGNLYRYFPSKAAIVEGLAERDRAELASDFDSFEIGGDFMASFARLGAKHFDDAARDRAALCMQIWAEATRDPAFRKITSAFDRDLHDRLVKLLRQAQRDGQVGPQVEVEAIAVLIQILADGLYVRRAILPDFAPEREVGRVMALIGAMIRGAVDLGARPEQAGISA